MKWLLYTFSFCMVYTQSLASTKELDQALIQSTKWAREALSVSDRAAIAAGLQYWSSFENRLPRNSPVTDEWLKVELSTTDTARIMRAVNTPEYALNSLLRQATDCIGLFEKLKAAVGKDQFAELYLWTKTLGCYARQQDTRIYLQRAGLNKQEHDENFATMSFGFYHDTVTGYLANSIAEERYDP